MKRLIVVSLMGLSLFALTACGLLEEPAAPSATLEAVPLELEATAVATETAPAEAPTEAAAKESMEEATPVVVVQETPIAEVEIGGLVVYSIVPASSVVRFELDEDLRGVRTTVVGQTDQIAGELAVDLSDLSTAQVGVIQINARTLITDNNFRNRAIQNEILHTDSYEFITFTPTAVNGLPDTVAVGDTVEFTIDGDLTIQDVTAPATFAVQATAVSANELSGTASTTITRDTYGLTIPSVPNVANVEEEVELYIDFVANATS